MVVNHKKNFLFKENIIYKKYYTLTELIDIKSSVDSTIEKYKKNNLSDEIINHLNNESSKNLESLYDRHTSKPKQGLYLISDDNKFLKIGITSSIKRRIKEITSANPREIKLLFFIPDLYLLEMILHSIFDKHRINNEWFYYDDSILDMYKKIDSNKEILSKIECRDILKKKLNNIMSS